MSISNSSKNKNTENSIIELSKNAINFLSKQYVRDGDKIIIKEKFIFQITCSMKKLQNWYCCSLMDQNSKFGGFCIRYEDELKIPKEGDIIEINNVLIIKLPIRNSYLYFCDNVKLIKESKELMKMNLDKINSKKKLEESKDINDININNNEIYSTPNKKQNKDNNSEDKDSNKSNKEYTLIKNIYEKKEIKNPIFYLKCISKSSIKKYKTEKSEGILQHYVFIDIEGEYIRIFAFCHLNVNYFNNIINVGNIYEISKLVIKENSSGFSENFPFIFTFLRYTTKVRKLEDKGDFNNIKYINENLITKIKDLKKDSNHNSFFNIIGIVLDNKGIIERKSEHKFRMLVIGDNSLFKIQAKLWVSRISPNRVFKKGDIIYLKNIHYNEYSIFNDLCTTAITEIFNGLPSPIEQELKDFYKKHPNSYEYQDMNLIYIRSKKEIEFKYISDLKKKYKTEIGDGNIPKYIKLQACIINITHRENSIQMKCDFCNKKVDSEHCPVCGSIPKIYYYIGIGIKDCSGLLYIELFQDKAESLLKISPEEYLKIIKENNEEKIKELNRKILYKYYVFYGKYTPIKGYFGGFSVIQFEQENNDDYKDLIRNLAYQLK